MMPNWHIISESLISTYIKLYAKTWHTLSLFHQLANGNLMVEWNNSRYQCGGVPHHATTYLGQRPTEGCRTTYPAHLVWYDYNHPLAFWWNISGSRLLVGFTVHTSVGVKAARTMVMNQVSGNCSVARVNCSYNCGTIIKPKELW